jgi:hypothetical protein
LLPLVVVSFFNYLKRGRPYGRVVLVIAAALAGAAAYLPMTRYSKEAVSYDSESMIAVSWLQGHTSTTIAGLVVAVGITLGAALALLTGRRLVAGLAVPVAIAVSILVTIPATQWDLKTHQTGPNALRWVDQAVGHAPVTLIATPSSGRTPMLAALYWNPSINRELIIPPTLGTDNYSTTPLQIGTNGSFLNGSSYFVYNRQGTHATIEGASIVKRVDDLVLYRTTSASPRFVDLVKGQLSNGFLSPFTELDVWGSGQAKEVTFTLSRPKHVPAATLFIGRQKFKIKAGASSRFACTSMRKPFVMDIRSLSEIPDEWDRPVIAKMTRLRAAAPRSVPAEPGCEQVTS